MADGRGALSGRNPVSSLVGGGGPAGEKQEELKGYLGVASVGVRLVCSGGTMRAGGRWRRWAAAGVLRRGVEGVGRLGSFTGARVSWWSV